jgi:hypothetical protein
VRVLDQNPLKELSREGSIFVIREKWQLLYAGDII